MTDRRKIKRLIQIWVALGIVAIVFGYGVFQATGFVRGPIIELSSPLNGSLVGTSLVNINGSAHNLSFLTLNDNKIFTDESGSFSEKILLSHGYNVITLKAQDRFGRTTEKTLQLIYK